MGISGAPNARLTPREGERERAHRQSMRLRTQRSFVTRRRAAGAASSPSASPTRARMNDLSALLRSA